MLYEVITALVLAIMAPARRQQQVAQPVLPMLGALALGAALGIVAVLVRQELVFMLMAGIFVMETVSVILQVASLALVGSVEVV